MTSNLSFDGPGCLREGGPHVKVFHGIHQVIKYKCHATHPGGDEVPRG